MRIPALLASAIALIAPAAYAQTPAAGPTRDAAHIDAEKARRVPVTVVLVSTLDAPDSIPAMILRRTSTDPRDVILLRRDRANGEQLAAAVLRLMIIRDRTGDTASVN